MNICSAPFAPSYWIPHLAASIPGIATDTFDRADTVSGLGVADCGVQWKNSAGGNDNSFAITSNLAKSLGGANAFAWLECFNPDATVSVRLPTNGNKVGLVARLDGAFLQVWFNAGNLEVVQSNTGTVLASVAQAATNGLTLKVSCIGSSINVYIDDVLKISTTITLNQFATKFGLFSDVNSTARFDNFNVVTPAPTSPSDDFNRVDNATSLGTSSSGHVWRAVAGTWSIQTNRARQASGGFAAAAVMSNRADCTIQVTLPVNSANGGGLAFRVTDISNFIRAAWNGGSLLLIKRVNNADTTITSTVFANANNQVLKVVLLGSSIQVYVDNVLKLTGTDSFNVLATQHGLFNGSSTTIRYDDFSIVG